MLNFIDLIVFYQFKEALRISDLEGFARDDFQKMHFCVSQIELLKNIKTLNDLKFDQSPLFCISNSLFIDILENRKSVYDFTHLLCHHLIDLIVLLLDFWQINLILFFIFNLYGSLLHLYLPYKLTFLRVLIHLNSQFLCLFQLDFMSNFLGFIIFNLFHHRTESGLGLLGSERLKSRF